MEATDAPMDQETRMSTIEHEVATIDQPRAVTVANPLDMDVTTFSAALVRRGDNRKALMQWVRDALVDGVDFGSIMIRGKASKPSLRKPGAEKICGMLGVIPTFPTLPDYERMALDGKTIESVILRCHLLNPDNRIVADGIGARSVAQDSGDLNKCLKMAAKSAHIDATLRMAGLSEIFTQDIEDMPRGQIGPEQPDPPPADGLVPSGKHRNKKWIEVGEDYLQWAINSEKAPAPLKAGCQKELERRDRARTADAAGIDGDEKIPH
jgi:hypothetical protein